MMAKAKATQSAFGSGKPARKANRLRGLESGPHDPVAFERHVHARKGNGRLCRRKLAKTAGGSTRVEEEEPQ